MKKVMSLVVIMLVAVVFSAPKSFANSCSSGEGQAVVAATENAAEETMTEEQAVNQETADATEGKVEAEMVQE